ncbi:MAG: DUF1275 domain-containing protein [Tissierellia bacterium]|nr:DUF1275 domain-containing protein [Tissierellia bacterium]
MKFRSKLVYLWIFMLTFIGGFINVGTIIFYGVPITHHTGNISQLTKGLYGGEYQTVILLFSVILAFFLGAFLSGLLFYRRELSPKKRYGGVLLICGIAVLIGWIFKIPASIYIPTIAFIQGLQNAMFIHYKGLLVRTTHMTGYLSDAGFNLGCALRGSKSGYRKFLFYISVVLCFFIGGLVSAFVNNYHPSYIFLIAGILYIFTGSYYFGIRRQFLEEKSK